MTEANQTKTETKTETKPETAVKTQSPVTPVAAPAGNRPGRPGQGGRGDMRRPGGGGYGGRRDSRDRKSFAHKNRPQLEFEKRIVSIRRVSRTYSGGKRMRLSVCLVVGDKKGKVGIAIGKGADVISAEEKAYNKAKRNMVIIGIKGTTISHQIQFKRGASKIMLRPAAPGTGVIAGSALRAVLECVGIEDILTKVIGAPNSINNAYACIDALQSLKQAK
jgi:small subunit ribosomal protein S5